MRLGVESRCPLAPPPEYLRLLDRSDYVSHTITHTTRSSHPNRLLSQYSIMTTIVFYVMAIAAVVITTSVYLACDHLGGCMESMAYIFLLGSIVSQLTMSGSCYCPTWFDGILLLANICVGFVLGRETANPRHHRNRTSRGPCTGVGAADAIVTDRFPLPDLDRTTFTI